MEKNFTFIALNLQMMKSLTTLILLTIIGTTAYCQVPDASTVISRAQSEAQHQEKNVFVIFHASWCGWCHKMDSAMNDPKVSSYFKDNYVVTHLTVLESPQKKDLENPGADKLLAAYHGDKGGIPFWYITDKNGKLLADSRMDKADGTKGDNVGCPAKADEVEYFMKVLKNTSKMNQNQLDKIKERFLKNS